MQKLTTLSCALLLGLSLGGCAFPGVYRIDIQQGNIVKQEDLDRLRPGMSRNQVQSVLGTPLADNPFSNDRDYYLYTFQNAGGPIVQQRVTVFYTADQYERHTADLLPETPAY